MRDSVSVNYKGLNLYVTYTIEDDPDCSGPFYVENVEVNGVDIMELIDWRIIEQIKGLTLDKIHRNG